jgi:hypothetical protein
MWEAWRMHTVTLTNLTYTILELNAALDTGKYDDIPMQEASQHIEAGDVIPWLQSKVPDVDLSALTGEAANEYQSALADIYGGYAGNERRKWGVERRALCLLIAWTNELVQQRRWDVA